MVNKMKNKRGWIRIVEALVAILLIAGFLVLILDSQTGEEKDISQRIYSSESAILREIQLNNTFRTYILGVGNTVVEFENFDPLLQSHINKRIPEYLSCKSKICDFATDSICDITSSEKNIYVKSIMIAGNFDTYSPKLIKLFCWTG